MDEFGSVNVVDIKQEEPLEEKPPVENPHDTYAVTGNPAQVSIKQEDGESKAFTGTVVQITNVSPQATLQQMATLFGFLGTIVDIRIYPTEETKQVAVKLCYVKFDSPDIGGVAQHLTNTVFIDKALIVVPLNINEIPEEGDCCQLLTSINAFAGLSTTFMSNPTNTAPISFPTPPVITSSLDPAEIDDIKRTVFIDNVDEEVTSSQLLAFFSGVGEIKYLRLCKQAEQGKYAFIEFSQVESVMAAMQYNGVLFGGRALKVNYAKSGIKKPESALIALGRASSGGSQVGGGTQRGPGIITPMARERSRSRSRSPRSSSASRRKRSRSKSRDRSHSRRRRSRSKSRSRDRSRRRRSRSRSKRKSRSRDRSSRRRRSRSRSKKKSKSRSRSRSKDKKKRSRRSRSRSKEKRKEKKRSKSRSRSRSPRRKKKSRSRSPKRSKRSRSRSSDRKKKDKRDKDKDEKKSSKDKDKKSSKKEKDREGEKKDKPTIKDTSDNSDIDETPEKKPKKERKSDDSDSD